MGAYEGVQVENDPKEYDYCPGYYAGFFYDPDGIKLEVLHVPRDIQTLAWASVRQ